MNIQEQQITDDEDPGTEYETSEEPDDETTRDNKNNSGDISDDDDEEDFRDAIGFPNESLENAVIQGQIEKYQASKPIEIVGPQRSRNVVESSMFQSRQNGYHMISSNEYKYMSEPQGFNYEIRNEYNGNSLNNDGSLQDSLKNVLSNSFHFLRMSINYLIVKLFKIDYLLFIY